MEINRKVFKGKLINSKNETATEIMYEVVIKNNQIYAKELYTEALFPYKNGICKSIFPSYRVWKSNIYDNLGISCHIYSNWTQEMEQNIVNNEKDINTYKDEVEDDAQKIQTIIDSIPFDDFEDTLTASEMKDLKFDLEDMINKRFNSIHNKVFKGFLTDNQGTKNNSKVFYQIVKRGEFIYAKEYCTKLLFPLYIDGEKEYIEMLHPEIDSPNNKYLYFSGNIAINNSFMYASNVPAFLIATREEVEDYVEGAYRRKFPLQIAHGLTSFKDKNINDIKQANQEERIEDYAPTSPTYLNNNVTLENIPKECSLLNDRDNLTNVVGREKETKELIKNTLIGNESVILIGDAGSGKTVLVENLVKEINKQDKKYLQDKYILEVSTGTLIGGTKYRGEFEEKLQGIIDFAIKYKGKVILFIDEIHTLYGLGKTEGSTIDAINILKPYIERKDIQIIGATTKEEYTETIAQDKAFSSRFNTIKVNNLPLNIKEEIIYKYFREMENEFKLNINLKEDELCNLSKILVNLSEHQDIRYKINSIRVLKRIIKASFTEAIYNEHDKVLIEDIITCLEITDELIIKKEDINNIKNLLNIKTNNKILKFKV